MKNCTPAMYELLLREYRLTWNEQEMKAFIRHNVSLDIDRYNWLYDIVDLQKILRRVTSENVLHYDLIKTKHSRCQTVSHIKEMYGKYASYGYYRSVTHELCHRNISDDSDDTDSNTDSNTYSYIDSDTDSDTDIDVNVDESETMNDIDQECCICADNSYQLYKMDIHPCYMCTFCINKLIEKRPRGFRQKLQNIFTCPLCQSIVDFKTTSDYQVVMLEE